MQEMQGTHVWSLGGEDHLEEEMATHLSVFAWKIPWTEEPGRLQSMGLRRVGHDWICVLSQYNSYAKEASFGAVYSGPLHNHNAAQIYKSWS